MVKWKLKLMVVLVLNIIDVNCVLGLNFVIKFCVVIILRLKFFLERNLDELRMKMMLWYGMNFFFLCGFDDLENILWGIFWFFVMVEFFENLENEEVIFICNDIFEYD